MDKRICDDWKDVLDVLQVRMMEERLVKGEYCLSTSGVGSPPHSLPSTSGTQNDKIEDVHCACISKLETQVEEQVTQTNLNVSSERNESICRIGISSGSSYHQLAFERLGILYDERI